ncbi:MAG: hypothetical protein A2992_02755 [Elusimicrobia bacterium RIFCSPLOWO2_01_FULL_59_12]|nr:MAG: hypothetical protein A2992_02755 [Elusimicrobia bacterium RIFCSPLOWO2_01_FULL_59_12]
MARERDIDEILEEKAGKFRERVEENVDKFRERVDEVRDRFEEAADKAIVRSEEAWKDAVKFTQKHPAQALGLAAVVGAALGVLLFGRRSD